MYWHKKRYTDQWNKEPRKKTQTSTVNQSITMEASMYNGGKSLYNEWCWENWTTTCKKIKLDYSLTPCSKINSKWIKDWNLRPETIKLLEENISNIHFAISLSNIFLDTSIQAREIKAKIKKWDYIKLKIFCRVKKLSAKQKGHLLLGEDNCKRYIW